MKTITTAEQMINFFPSLTIITLPMTHPSVMKLDSQLIGMNGVSNNCFIRVSTSKCLPTYLKFLPTYLPTSNVYLRTNYLLQMSKIANYL